jgi:Concanavalin A-like lectin/glucanases superfamily
MKNQSAKMKRAKNWLLAGTAVIIFCSSANAQLDYSNSLAGATLIYSNAFNGGAVDINGTAPTYINPSAVSYGGSSSALWDVVTNNPGGGVYYANQDGTLGSGLNSVLLPFTPTSGYVYTLSASLTFVSIPPGGGWGALGYAAHIPPSNTAPGRFNDPNVNGNPWALLNYGSQGGGAGLFDTRSHEVGNVANLMSALNTPYTINLVVDATGTNWHTALYVAGTFVKEADYSSNPTISSIGYGQTTTTAGAYKWNSLTLSASPLVITKQPISAGVASGSAFTNTVGVAAVNPFYQWYNNGVPILNATNASLIINPVTPGDAGTNYYVVVTNSLGGSATSAPATLTVYSAPNILAAFPVTYTNVMTLYGGGNVGGTNYPGSSPTFSVSVIAAPPISYQWMTNGVAVAGATNASFTFTNCPLNGPTSFACVVSNPGGSATNTWLATYLPTPTASFPSTVLSYNPVGFWRLNEGPDNFNGDDGVIGNDYQGGNNGLYTNVVLGYAGYTNTDPTDGSVRFGYYDAPNSDLFGIQGIDFSNNVSATFSVQAWVNGSATQPNGACILAKGYDSGEQFALDVYGGKYRFLVRNAAGTPSSVTATTGPDDTWHFIVGVCDEANGSVSLYVDGLIVGTASIASGSGILANATPITIGARGSTPTDTGSLQFYGYLSDLAVYNQAISAGQVAKLWGNPLGLPFVPPLPPTNYVFQANGTIAIPATVFGQAPIGYYWTNLTTGTVMGSGSTNAFGSLDIGNLNATLTFPNAPASLSGDQLELIVTNATSSTNWFVTLFSPPPPVQLDYSNPILYSNNFNGGWWSVAGMPLTAANLLVGGTNTTWTDALGTNDTGKLQANGTPTTTQGDTWLLPFTPHAGYIYTLTTVVTLPSYPGSWVGMGFAQNIPTNATPDCVINGSVVNGYAWQIDTAGGTQNLQAFQGAPGNPGNLQVVNVNGAYPALPTSITNTVVLDTTGSSWTATFYCNGVLEGSTSYATAPPIHAVCITQHALGAPQNIQWNSFTLTQVAPNGAPPYVLNPQPPTSVTLLADSPLSIPATAFSSFAPYGYTWSNTNTAAVLGVGVTNNVAPLNANLNVADVPITWNGNTLALVLTNAYGTNISLVTLTVTNATIVPTNSPTITGFSLIGGSNVMINATNGQSGATYYLLGSTNLATPLSQWLPLATNVVVTNGSAANGFTFTGTNVISLSNPQQFYILSSTN